MQPAFAGVVALALAAASGPVAWAGGSTANDPWSGRYAVMELGQGGAAASHEHREITIRATNAGVSPDGWLMTGVGLPRGGVSLRAVDSSEYEGLIDTAAALTCLGGDELFVCHADPGSVAIGDGGGAVVLKTGPDAQTHGEGDTYVVKNGLFIVSLNTGVVALTRLKADDTPKE